MPEIRPPENSRSRVADDFFVDVALDEPPEFQPDQRSGPHRRARLSSDVQSLRPDDPLSDIAPPGAASAADDAFAPRDGLFADADLDDADMPVADAELAAWLAPKPDVYETPEEKSEPDFFADAPTTTTTAPDKAAAATGRLAQPRARSRRAGRARRLSVVGQVRETLRRRRPQLLAVKRLRTPGRRARVGISAPCWSRRVFAAALTGAGIALAVTVVFVATNTSDSARDTQPALSTPAAAQPASAARAPRRDPTSLPRSQTAEQRSARAARRRARRAATRARVARGRAARRRMRQRAIARTPPPVRVTSPPESRQPARAPVEACGEFDLCP